MRIPVAGGKESLIGLTVSARRRTANLGSLIPKPAPESFCCSPTHSFSIYWLHHKFHESRGCAGCSATHLGGKMSLENSTDGGMKHRSIASTWRAYSISATPRY